VRTVTPADGMPTVCHIVSTLVGRALVLTPWLPPLSHDVGYLVRKAWPGSLLARLWRRATRGSTCETADAAAPSPAPACRRRTSRRRSAG
jgi:hypothetical protein